MARTVNARVHRRLARMKRRLERVGAERLPGYRTVAQKARRVVFPGLGETGGTVRIRLNDFLLDVPRELLPEYLHRDYEPITTRAVLAALPAGAVAVDVGANIGYFTCLAARAVGPRGVVHAIEPAPENVEALKRNVQLNGFRNV